MSWTRNGEKYTEEKSENKIDKLKLTNGDVIDVRVLGEEKFGTYQQKEYMCPIYSFESLKWFTDKIHDNIRKSYDQVILITGRERIGKTTLGLLLSTELDPNFSVDSIAFTQDEFKKKVQEAEDESVLILDEAGVSLFSREWMMRGQRELIKSFMIFGIKRLKIILILPHITMLDYQLRNRRVGWWLSCYNKGSGGRGYARLRRAQESEWKMDIFWKPRFTLHFPKLDSDLWNVYEKRKREFIDDQLSGKYDKSQAGMSIKEKRYAKEKHDIVRKLNKRGDSTKEIARIVDYNESHVREILREDAQ